MYNLGWLTNIKASSTYPLGRQAQRNYLIDLAHGWVLPPLSASDFLSLILERFMQSQYLPHLDPSRERIKLISDIDKHTIPGIRNLFPIWQVQSQSYSTVQRIEFVTIKMIGLSACRTGDPFDTEHVTCWRTKYCKINPIVNWGASKITVTKPTRCSSTQARAATVPQNDPRFTHSWKAGVSVVTGSRNPMSSLIVR